MAYTYEIFEVREPRSVAVSRGFWVLKWTETRTEFVAVGCGYRLLRDESPVIVQDYDPDQTGFVPMTEERAKDLAEREVSRLLETEREEEQRLVEAVT